MEFTKFINLLKKHKFGIAIIPILVMGLTFMLVKSMPNVYISKGRLSAGITDRSQQLLSDRESQQESKINQTFSNLIQTLQLKTVYDQVSYKLILHELTNQEQFRKPSGLMNDLNESARKHAVEVYSRKYANRQPLSLYDNDEKGLNEVLKSMKFDYEALKNKVKIYRIDNSDFIDLEYESENPQLSAFVINTLSSEFISYYFSITQQNELKAIDYLSDLLMKKKDSLNQKMDHLKNYKIQKRVLNLNEQARSLYGQIADYETKLELVEKEVQANSGAIRNIDSKFTDHEKKYLESSLEGVNKEIVATQEQLNALNDAYIKSNFDKGVKAKIDAVKETLNQKIAQSADKYIVTPLNSKEGLVAQKLKLEVELELAKNSISSLRGAIANLNRRLDVLVPNEAVIQSYESEISVAGQEYIEILKKFNQTSMDLNASVRIKQIEIALPGTKQPSKKIILVALSGVVSFALYVFVLFVLFYLDHSVKNPAELAIKTDMRVLGFLPVIKSSFLDIQKLWTIDPEHSLSSGMNKLMRTASGDLQKLAGATPINPSNAEFKKLIRSARFEINMALMGGRNLVITSLVEGEGKTLFSLSLVSAYQMMNKKILLIDGNFLHSAITEMTQPKYFIEDYLMGKTSLYQLVEESNISVLGNYGCDISLFEINNEYEINQKLLELKDAFDIILIEASALSTLNQSKEWIVVADRVLSVFEANTTITHEMKEQILYLKGLETKFIGWVLNKVTS